MSQATLDPIAALEQMAKRQAAEELAAKALSKARVKLVLGKDAKAAFFATLALRMRPVVDWERDTASTNGRELRYSPAFVNELTPDQRVGMLAHEVMHNAMAHHCRRAGREPKRWNVACDCAINDILKEAGFILPAGALFPGQGPCAKLAPGLSAEEYYAQLPDDPRGSTGEGGDDPGGCGGVEDAGDHAAQEAAQAETRVQVAQAASAAKQRGTLPGGLARVVGEIVEPKIAWQDVLREFMSRTLSARDDYSWSAPNRRFIAQGLYLPSLKSEAMGEVVVAIDTSGSIDDETLKTFSGELNGILECRPCRVSVVYCDDGVNRVDEWEPSDGPLTLQGCGGGGTSHCPVWEWLKQQGGEPACVVCLTDGYTEFGDDPGVPVLWALTEGSSAEPPFGRAVHIA